MTGTLRPAAAALLAAALAAPGPAWAKIGLSTDFVEVAIEGLEPGHNHGLNDFSELRYALRNPGDEAVDALLAAERPDAAKVEAPYEPIPELSWVRFSADKVRIPARGSATSEIAIHLPDDPRLFGRHFETAIRARTRGKGLVAAGVRSRLRFSVGPAPRERGKAAAALLPCALEPEDIFVRRGKGTKARVQLVNSGDEPLDLVLRAVPWPPEAGRPLPRGYMAPAGLDWVKVSPARLEIPKGESAALEVAWVSPPELKGRRVAFAVRAETPDGRASCRPRRAFVELE